MVAHEPDHAAELPTYEPARSNDGGWGATHGRGAAIEQPGLAGSQSLRPSAT
jgi:hypothetical protein